MGPHNSALTARIFKALPDPSAESAHRALQATVTSPDTLLCVPFLGIISAIVWGKLWVLNIIQEAHDFAMPDQTGRRRWRFIAITR